MEKTKESKKEKINLQSLDSIPSDMKSHLNDFVKFLQYKNNLSLDDAIKLYKELNKWKKRKKAKRRAKK